ncbi:MULTISPECIES: BBE domain-containing protein [Shewanella]|uniref:BBE domain-containing protein n=1 Tax=Shewanella TaxID=22 RepID=UPI000AD8797A|nr:MULTISPECIES: BBE domain-containing protein [Shewanella]
MHVRWESADDDKRCIAWAREFFDKTKPFASGGAYINFLTDDETDRTEAAYGETYGRLQQLKKQYDPNNLFRVNQNIKPA